MINDNLNINYNSQFQKTKYLLLIKDLKSSKENNDKIQTIKKYKTKHYINNLNYIYSYLVHIFLIKYILFLLPKKVKLYSPPENYITLKVNKIGEQQIFSDEYNIDEFYPYRIYINSKVKIMKNKKVFVEKKNTIIKLEWINTNSNYANMFSNLLNIESITINNMLNDSLNNISYMFFNCQNLKSFILTGKNNNYQIIDATKMFYNCSSLTSVSFKNIYKTNGINISYIFYNCYKLTYIHFSSEMKVNDMNNMFYNCSSLEFIDLSNFHSVNEVNVSFLFYNCHNLVSFKETNTIFSINDMSYMFYNCSKIDSFNLNNFKIGSSTNMSFLFYNCNNLSNIEWISGMDHSSIPSDMNNMFYNCTSIISINLPFYEGNENINMSRMFYNCNNLTNIEFQNTNPYYPNDMHEMFFNCSSLESLDLRNKIITDNTLDMSYLFFNCTSLNSLQFIFQNKETKNMQGIFQNCKSFTSLDLSNFFTPNVEIMWDMFKDCSQLSSLNLETFDTSKVTDMESMFEGCSSLISLSLDNFETSKVQYMNKMFKDCTNLTSLNFKTINTKSVGTFHQMFYNCQNLEYLNIYSMTENGQSYAEMFSYTSNNFTFCIKEKENIPNIFELLFNKTNTIRDCSNNCYDNTRVNISLKKLCCPYFRYEDNCYNKCPAKTRVKDQINICEDFICPNDNEYYDYEQNNCINNIKGYYINDTEYKTIDKCHEDCSECKTKWTNESTKCTKCKNEKPYIYLGNCYSNCTPGFYQRDKCKCFNTKCEICSEDSLEYNLCETCNEDYYPMENDSTNYNGWINCYNEPENYFLLNDIYKPCFSSCKYCQKEGNYERQFCLSCNDNNSFALIMDESIDSIYNCYPNCTYYYYFDENKKYQCTKENKCPEDYDKLIDGDRRCVKSCSETKKNKYEFRKVCYESCPSELSFNLNESDYFCRITCPFEAPFEMVKEQICVAHCTIMERKDKLCITNYIGNRSNDEVQNKVMASIQDDIIDTFDYKYINENVSIILEEIDNTYEIVTTNKKENPSETKTSYISLGTCETTLKNYYSIDKDEPLYLLKLDAYREGMQNPKVVYLVYYPLNGFKLEQLDLTLCEGDGVSLFFSANISNDEDYYNKNSGYYNDVCYTTTSDDGTDISLIDRQQNFAENNQSLCEEGCEFVKYHYDKDKAECACNVKIETPLVSEIKINKDALYKFVDIKKIANFDVMKCFNLLLDRKGIVKNIGLYIFLPAFIMYFICLIIFYKKEYNLVKMNIDEIIKAKVSLKYILENKDNGKYEVTFYDMIKSKGILSKHLINKSIKNKKNREVNQKNIINSKTEGNENIYNFNGEELKPKQKIIRRIKIKKRIKLKNAPPSKIKKAIKNEKKQFKKEMLKLKESKESSTRKTIMEVIEAKKEIDIENDINMIDKYKYSYKKEELDKIKEILKYNENELNSMNYELALKYDHRSFLSYYFALLKSKHLIITLFDKQDYNSRIIKIFLCFYNFASCYAVNGLFFDDDTMHKIYEDKGNYNFFAQLPQIIYSTIIGYLIDNLFNYLALPKDDIIVIKQEQETELIEKKKNILMKTLNIKFIFFFILTFLFLVLFWYYTSCFCAVYKNTQFHLLKDSLISFATSIGTPFGVCLLTALFRYPALKKKSKSHRVMFELSKFIQFF